MTGRGEMEVGREMGRRQVEIKGGEIGKGGGLTGTG